MQERYIDLLRARDRAGASRAQGLCRRSLSAFEGAAYSSEPGSPRRASVFP
jgi:hypothetical protein